MKKITKIAAMAAAMSMAGAIAFPAVTMTASAASSSITIDNVGEVSHEFEVYQIMTGKKTGDEFTELKWGTGISGYGGTAVTTGNDVPNDVLDALSASNFDARTLVAGDNPLMTLSSTKKNVSGSGTITIEDLEEGYYVIKDVTDLSSSDDANSAWMIQVAGPTTISIKKAKPSVDKEVYDNADGNAAAGWVEAADHTINETFQFRLTATIPADADLAVYDTYKLVFHDTMSSGVTFDSIASVKVNGTDVADTAYSTDANAGDSGKSWALTIENVKPLAGSAFGSEDVTVEVIYDAHLNENAIVSDNSGSNLAVNNNKVKLEYSNNPDSLGTGGSDDTGETPEDSVWVFTYKIDNTKYRINTDAGNELNGAKFTLHKNSQDGEVVGVTWNAALGAYVTNGTTSGDMTSGQGDAEGTTSGKFNIVGLDAGEYYLVEDSAPTGYNVAEPVGFTITATHTENESTEGADLVLSQPSDENKIVDTKNSTLPDTGGIGTKLFIAGGGLTAALAGIYIVSKKRSEGSED